MADHRQTARDIVQAIPPAETRPVNWRDLLAQAIEMALGEAVKEEREACAKVADEYPKRDPAEDGNGYWAAEEIAAAIRERT